MVLHEAIHVGLQAEVNFALCAPDQAPELATFEAAALGDLGVYLRPVVHTVQAHSVNSVLNLPEHRSSRGERLRQVLRIHEGRGHSELELVQWQLAV